MHCLQLVHSLSATVGSKISSPSWWSEAFWGSQNITSLPLRAPSSSEMCSLPMLVKDGWLSLDRKSSNALLQPVLRAYMMTRKRHK